MKFFQSTSCEISQKNQVGIMMLRGVAGIGLMAWSIAVLPKAPLLGLLMMGASVWLLKGCPACWGMHMVNAVRGSAKKRQTDTSSQTLAETSKPKRPYQPRDMSAHLFPPEDVARFQEMRQINSSPASNDEKTHVV